MSQLILSGGDTESNLPLKRSEVNHLRLLLGWMRCEYMLDEDMQRGFMQAARWSAEDGREEQARALVAEQAEKIRHVPQYVRHGVKMLTRLIREHEKRAGIVDGEVVSNRLENPAE